MFEIKFSTDAVFRIHDQNGKEQDGKKELTASLKNSGNKWLNLNNDLKSR